MRTVRALVVAVALAATGCSSGEPEPTDVFEAPPAPEADGGEVGEDEDGDVDGDPGDAEDAAQKALDAAGAHLEAQDLDVHDFQLEVRGTRDDGTLEVRAEHVDDLADPGTLGAGGGESRVLHLDPDTFEVVADLRSQ